MKMKIKYGDVTASTGQTPAPESFRSRGLRDCSVEKRYCQVEVRSDFETQETKKSKHKRFCDAKTIVTGKARKNGFARISDFLNDIAGVFFP